MLHVGVLASGRGTNLEALLDAQEEDALGAEVTVVVSDRDECQAIERARARGVDAAFVDPEGRTRTEHDGAVVDVLEEHDVDLVVLAGYMRIVTPRLLTAFPDRVINIHPSLLPSFRGLDAQRQAIEAGVRISGCTTHVVAEDVDAGPVILQAAVPVDPDDTVDDLADRILEQEHRILPATVRLFADGRIDVDPDGVRIKGATRTDGSFISPGGVLP